MLGYELYLKGNAEVASVSLLSALPLLPLRLCSEFSLLTERKKPILASVTE
jgi:hypothetical protein